MELIQMAITTGFFGALGAMTTYRWIETTGRGAEYSRQLIWILTFFAAIAAAAYWVLLNVGLNRLPKKWVRLEPILTLIGLAAFQRWKPTRTTVAERESTHRMRIAILIGGFILITFYLLVFWLQGEKEKPQQAAAPNGANRAVGAP